MSSPPSTIVQGDSATWEHSDSRFPTGWTAKTLFVPDQATDPITVTGTISGTTATFDLTPTISGTLTPGGITRWYVVIENTGDSIRETPNQGLIRVQWDPLATSKAQTHARTMLGLIETRLQGQAVEGEETVGYLGVNVTFHSMDELERLRNYYQREVKAEERRDAGQPGTAVKFGRIRFTR